MMTRTKRKRKLKLKGNKDGSRRYAKEAFPNYDNTYQRLKKDSSILNDRKRANDYRNAGSLYDISNCESALVEITGNPEKDGYYLRNGNWKMALIPSARKQLRKVLKKFKSWQKEQVKKGITLKSPKEWPDHLREERLKAEALLDIRRREKTKVEDKIRQLKEQQGKLEKREILPEGPVGEGINHDTRHNSDWIIDGQKVSYKNGIPFIDEPDSPYDRMPVVTYRKMSKHWLKEHQISKMSLIKRKNEFVESKREADEEIPANFSWRKFKSKLKREDRWPKNPDWPKDAKTIDEID